MRKRSLKGLHLADLHAAAAAAGIEGFRMLGPDELVDRLRVLRVDPVPAAAPVSAPARSAAAGSAGGAEPRRPRREEADLGEVSGILEVMPGRHGFLRLSGPEPAEGDVYLSASQIRRCELRAGDEVAGPARSPRRGERHPALVRVERVNGAELVAAPDRPRPATDLPD